MMPISLLNSAILPNPNPKPQISLEQEPTEREAQVFPSVFTRLWQVLQSLGG